MQKSGVLVGKDWEEQCMDKLLCAEKKEHTSKKEHPVPGCSQGSCNGDGECYYSPTIGLQLPCRARLGPVRIPFEVLAKQQATQDRRHAQTVFSSSVNLCFAITVTATKFHSSACRNDVCG